ncbi:diphosphomevalonate decarboxylase [Candidatus Bathyarchaeota archaeon]|nr:diphosphomevalonate decarboxylase [Candidatus Bathyarchaeota archaeon]
MKHTAIAHPIQGLIKYHGLKNSERRIPFHDSISVCVNALHTTTTVETIESLEKDLVVVNERKIVGSELKRVELVFNQLREMTHFPGHFKVISRNDIASGKGLGFSASGFAALGKATCAALGLEIDYVSLSELVRLGAGSATRSLAGSFARWFADKKGRSYAEQLVEPDSVDFGMVVVPIYSKVKTDDAHAEVTSSPLFRARLDHVPKILGKMEEAIRVGDVTTIGRLAEEDTLSLHASTMTGKARMFLWEPKTVRIIREVQQMRSEGVPAWYSIDTGPSVFVNTFRENTREIADRLEELGIPEVIESRVGGEPFLSHKHLF